MVLFLAGLISLAAARLLKNRYYHSFEQDELFKSKKTTNSKNDIYFSSGETAKYIKKYVLCITSLDKYLVCNYVRSFNDITYFVIEYTAHRRVIGVKQIREFGTGLSSKIIAIHKKCAYVNVVIGTADGVVINTDVIRPLSLVKVRLNAFLTSLTMFTGLFWVRHILIEILGGQFIKFYLTDLMNYIAVGASFVLALLSYLITVLCYRKKNNKALNGGALEYEFV